MTQVTQGQAQALFQSTAAKAGIVLAGLDPISQMQLVLATLLGPGTTVIPGSLDVKGTLTVEGSIATSANGIEPATDGAGSVGDVALRFASGYFVNVTTTHAITTDITLNTQAVTKGAADSGGSGFALLRVPN